MRHRDLVVNDWASEYQERVGWIIEEGERMIHPWLIDRPNRSMGVYSFATDLHDDADCPFKDGERVAMTRRPWACPKPLPTSEGGV